MEPAVKPAAEHTQSGVVGVLATPATFQGELYASVVERFAQGVTILQHTCPGLVGQIEAGNLAGIETRSILESALLPMLAQGIDTVVLGCTHYPFVIPLIQEIAGARVRVIDPAPAVARQAARLLEERGLRDLTAEVKKNLPVKNHPEMRFLTSGEAQAFQHILPALLGEAGTVQAVRWGTNGPELI